jgi:flap endonuclease-1
MGVSDLRDICHIRKVDDEDIKNTVVAVDGNNWLYKYLNYTTRYNSRDNYVTNEGDEVPNLIGIPKGLKKFSKFNITPVFVFDGDYHYLKEDEVSKRKEKRQDARKKAEEERDKGNEIEASKYESRSLWFSDEIMETTKEILDILDFEYIIASKSAESQAAHMVRECSGYDMSLTVDYDSVLFGCPLTLRNIISTSRDTEVLDLEKTLSEHDIKREQLVDVSLLCGTDYNEGIKGIGPKTGLKKIKENGSIENLDIDLDFDYKEIRSIFMNPDVTDDYPRKISLPNPDKEEAKNYISSLGVRVESECIDNLDFSQSGLEMFG